MRRLWSPKWIAVHAGVLVLVTVFLGLGWWQLHRAAGGNLLSFGYAVEWPTFAAFVIFIWVKEMRRGTGQPADPAAGARPTGPSAERARQPVPVRRGRGGASYDDSADPELAAYNRYLAWLNANPRARPADYWHQPMADIPSKEVP